MLPVNTVIETIEFTKQADAVWSESERMEFICWIARYPLAGDVIPGAEGLRKVRWKLAGKGKRGGVRVIYFNRSAEGRIYLIAIYRKADRSNIDPSELPELDR